jgi:hypothetical protein
MPNDIKSRFVFQQKKIKSARKHKHLETKMFRAIYSGILFYANALFEMLKFKKDYLMKAFLSFLSVFIFVWAINSSYSEDWKAKKWPAVKTNPAPQSVKPIQGYSINSGANHQPTVYIPGQRPPVDLSGSTQNNVSFPQEAPPLTVSIPDNPYETVSIPNSNPTETVTPLPGYPEPEETVQIPYESGS